MRRSFVVVTFVYTMFKRLSGKKDLSDVLRFQKISGFWFYFDEKRYMVAQILRFIHYVVIFILTNVIAYKIGFKNALSGSYFLVSWGFYGIPQVLTYLIYRKKANDIVDKLRIMYGKMTEDWQWDMFHKHSRLPWLVIFFGILAATTFVTTYYSLSMLQYFLPLISNTVENGEKAFSFSYPLKEIQSENIDFKFYGIFLVSFSWTTNTILYGVGTIGFLPMVCSYCCIAIQILRKTIDDGGKNKLFNKRDFFKKIITNHNEILRIVEDAQVVLGPAEGAQIATGSVLLTLLVYALLDIEDNLILTGLLIGCFLIMTLVNFSICIFGEMLQIQGDKLFECLCCLPWDEMTPETRKEFNLILVQARKPIVLSFKGLLPVNFESFQFMMSTSYSCLMLLITMKE